MEQQETTQEILERIMADVATLPPLSPGEPETCEGYDAECPDCDFLYQCFPPPKDHPMYDAWQKVLRGE